MKFLYNHNSNFTNILADVQSFSSIMRSKRRFKSLSIFSYQDQYGKIETARLERLVQILQRFGKHIKELDVSHELPLNIIELLNNMPNLEKISFYAIFFLKPATITEGEIKLHKLKKFKSYKCNSDVLCILNKLPPGVLQELDIERTNDCYYSDRNTQLFPNQHNIKKIKADEDFAR
jgi:hypothetical protein